MHQTSYELACEVLGGALRSAVRDGGVDRGMVGSVHCRAAAALYVLLVGHPVDRRGRCLSCRRPGAVFGWRWRRCRVHNEARVWLHQPAEFVNSRLARELAIPVASRPADQDATEVLPRIAADDPRIVHSPRSPRCRPSSPADSPQRGGRTRLTAGPGSPFRLTPGPAVRHSTAINRLAVRYSPGSAHARHEPR
ncbi:MAG: hypothetical protein ACRDRV_14275 [Pseudonocardiaceae bacterium]